MVVEHQAVMVDTCVLLDVATEDAAWFEWSASTLATAAAQSRIVINAVIFAELAVGYQSIERMTELLDPQIFEYREISREAAFLAAKAFTSYRKRGGRKTKTLPDFFIGAHACVDAMPLITRDVKRFRTYFPKLDLIHP